MITREQIADAIRSWRAQVGSQPGRLVLNPVAETLIGSEPIEGLTPEWDPECPADRLYLLPAGHDLPAEHPSECEHVSTEASPINCVLCGRRLAWPSASGQGAIGIDRKATEYLHEQICRKPS